MNQGVYDKSTYPISSSVNPSSLTLKNWTGIMPMISIEQNSNLDQKFNKKLSSGYVVLFVLVGIGFMIPWILLTIYFLRKRKRLQQL